jgi:hypothetical protein
MFFETSNSGGIYFHILYFFPEPPYESKLMLDIQIGKHGINLTSFEKIELPRL